MKRLREVVDGENIPACIVVLKPHHSNFAREGEQYSSHGDESTLILHLNSTSISTAAPAATSTLEISEVLDSSSKGIQSADCSTGGVSEPLISDRPGIIVHGDGGKLREDPGIIVHGDGGKLREEPKKERRKKEKRKKHRPKVVEIEKPEKKSKMETPNPPETPQQKSLGRKKGKVIGRTFAGKKMVADSLDDENDWEEVDDQHIPVYANKPIIPSSRIQIDGDELAAKVDVEPSSCNENAQMAHNSVVVATTSSIDVNLSVDELLQELAKLLEKPSSPQLLKEELLLLNMESFVDTLRYIVDNISIPCLLYFVNHGRRRMARSRPKVGHKLKKGLDHSTNEVLEKLIYVLMKFLPFLVSNNDLSQVACRKFNNRKNVGSRKNIIGSKEQKNTPKKSSISKAHSNFQIIPSMQQHDFTSRFQSMEALRTAPANFTINGKLTRNWQNISSNCMELALENVIDKFKVLDINRVYGKDDSAELHCALVPFIRDGMIVPYEGPFEKIKQKQYRVEVLLDPVSDRVLKFLQENEGGDDVEGMDFSMFKWWENERRVFVGRAKYFIARMNLILGDRQFSPWKGSIVDSVVGVFLTQNVSDHLSSSAFMSLAAKFPLHSRDEGRSSQSILAEQHEERSNDAITFLKDIPSLSNCDDQDSAVVHGDGHQEVDLASQSHYHQNFMGSTRIESCEHFMEIDVEGCITKHAANLSNSFVVNAENEFRDLPQVFSQSVACSNLNNGFDETVDIEKELAASCSNEQKTNFRVKKSTLRTKKKVNTDDEAKIDWECLRRKAYCNIGQNKRNCDKMDSVNWEAVRNAEVSEISAAIRERGMYNLLAERIKDFLNRLVRDHGSIDLEWLRNICPDEAKEYLLSIRGLGLKSVECIRLLALQNVAFPVDTNVARISVRLGWVPLKPLPEFLQLHLLEQYPIMDSVQKYIWPRLCKLDQKTLYELHYHMITFGKVFCTKSRPNCSVCPLRGECKHFTSAKLALPAPEDKQLELPSLPSAPSGACSSLYPMPQLQYEESKLPGVLHDNYSPTSPTPIIEEPPPSPSGETIQILETDIEDAFYEDDEIPAITLNMEKLAQNLQNFVQKDNLKVPDNGISRALVEISAEVASIPIPKLKNVSGLRTEHHVYELRDSHPLLKEMDQREPDDQSPYLLAIWTPGETAQSTEPPESLCESQEKGKLCDRETCFSCNNRRELEAHTVRGTILIPCRTAMRGRFPLNGTYFQINEVFADHDSSRNPIHVPRSWLWNLPRRTVYFGTSVAAIFRGFSAVEPIQFCFSKGFICVRGFDRKTREPKPLYARLHLPRSKAPNSKKPWMRQEE